ncbi:MAG: thioredoxin fold domain-containing protein [Candidatus Gastranaerophilales bacterium]|nr:thioredoxin fold domain-containing protein [Candidatus Gastranaerophilales bacterium]
MSEERIELEEKEHKCSCNKMMLLVVLSFLLSVASLTTSIYTMVNGGGITEKEVVISKQIDKGRSMEKALKTGKPVVVFFYTDWCTYSKKFAPIFNKVAKDREFKKNFAVAFVNAQLPENNKYADEFGIKGYPAMYIKTLNGKKLFIDNQTFLAADPVKNTVKNLLEMYKGEDK